MKQSEAIMYVLSKDIWLSAMDVLVLSEQLDDRITRMHVSVMLRDWYKRGLILRRSKAGAGSSRMREVYQWKLPD